MQKKQIDFSKYTSIKIGFINEVTIIESPLDYYEILNTFKNPKIIGCANNLLVAPNTNELIKLGNEFDYIKDCGDYLEVGANTKSGKLFSYAKENNLSGFEILCGLPGSIGGIIKMNAGLKEYEIKKNLLGILSIKDSSKLEFIDSKLLNLGYRTSNINSLIFAGIFKKEVGFNESLVPLFRQMRSNQPKEPSFGSCFKNPPNNFAGKIIEECGLKGISFGKNKSLMFSPKHANFLINLGNSSFFDAIELISLAKQKALEIHKIQLQEEVQILQGE